MNKWRDMAYLSILNTMKSEPLHFEPDAAVLIIKHLGLLRIKLNTLEPLTKFLQADFPSILRLKFTLAINSR